MTIIEFMDKHALGLGVLSFVALFCLMGVLILLTAALMPGGDK